MPKVRVGKYTIKLPRSRVARLGLGGALVAGGTVGFLPILGFWMIPAGLLVLSHDLPAVRRFRRRVTVAVRSWWSKRERPKRKSA